MTFDQAKFDEIKQKAVRLRDRYQTGSASSNLVQASGSKTSRNERFRKFERAFLCDPLGTDEGRTSANGARFLFDTRPPDTINAVVRMYIQNDPSFSVLYSDTISETESPENADKSNTIAKQIQHEIDWITDLFTASNLTSQHSLVSDALFAAATYGELPIITHNLIDESLSNPEIGMEGVADESSPFVFQVPHPSQSYPDYSPTKGLIAHVYEVEMTAGMIKLEYGVRDWLTDSDENLLTVVDYMDKTQHWVWVEQHNDEPLLFAEIPARLGIIPRVSMLVGGAPSFLSDEAQKRRPIIATYLDSGLYAAMNVYLTILHTQAVDFTSNKTIHTKRPGSESVLIDPAKRGDVIEIEEGEKLEPFMQRLYPPEMLQFGATLMQRGNITTMPEIIGGTAPGGVFAASGLNLLATLARMSMYPIREAVEIALAQTFSRVLRWVKARGDAGGVSVFGKNGVSTLKASEIISTQVRVKLNPDMAMERQAVLGMATQMYRGMNLYDSALRLLAEGGLVQSVQGAKDEQEVRAFIDANLPNIAKGGADLASHLMGITASIPPTGPAQMGNPADKGGVPPGSMPPDAQDMLSRLQGTQPPGRVSAGMTNPLTSAVAPPEPPPEITSG